MNESYNCAICHETFVEPTVLTCGHTYCAGCIKSMVNKRCAMDNKPFKSTVINYALQSIISDVYKDDVDYQKRIKKIENKKKYEKTLKYLRKSAEFQRVFRLMCELIETDGLQISLQIAEHGKVLFWTCFDRILQEEGDPIRLFGDYVFTVVPQFIMEHHEEMSKSDIVKLINPQKVSDRQIRKMVDEIMQSEDFLEDFDAYIENIKNDIEKMDTIKSLHKKIGWIGSNYEFRGVLRTSKNHDLKKLLELLEIPTNAIYNNETKKWVRKEDICKPIYLEYQRKIQTYNKKEDIDETSDSAEYEYESDTE